jgi:hypothetical protein
MAGNIPRRGGCGNGDAPPRTGRPRQSGPGTRAAPSADKARTAASRTPATWPGRGLKVAAHSLQETDPLGDLEEGIPLVLLDAPSIRPSGFRSFPEGRRPYPVGDGRALAPAEAPDDFVLFYGSPQGRQRLE